MENGKSSFVVELAKEFRLEKKKTGAVSNVLLMVLVAVVVAGLVVRGIADNESSLSLALTILASWLVHIGLSIRAELRYNNELIKDLCKMNHEQAADARRAADSLALRIKPKS